MKTPRTEMLLHPSLEECVRAAVGLGMPEAEGRKFFYHYESNGWKVGRLPMKSFAGAMGGWCERWKERGGSPALNGHHQPAAMSGADKMIKQKELERVLDRIKVIRSSYDSHADRLRPDDQVEMGRLIGRKKQLMTELGVVV